MAIGTKFETKRLILEPLTLADTQAIYDIAKERQSIEDFQYVACSIDDVKSWLEHSYNDLNSLVWIVRKKGKTIGLFEVCFEAEYSGLETNVCRVGYFLDFRGHNHGYATEALQAIVEWLFHYTDVERIEAGVTLHNIPSYRVLEKVGFIREKIIESNWKWYNKLYDSAYYFLLKHSPSDPATEF